MLLASRTAPVVAQSACDASVASRDGSSLTSPVAASSQARGGWTFSGAAERAAPRVRPHVVLPDLALDDGRFVSFARRVATSDGGAPSADTHAVTYAGVPLPGLANPSFTNDLVGWDVTVPAAAPPPTT